jgi:hypothetical protein
MSSINPGDNSNILSSYQRVKDKIRTNEKLEKHSLAEASLRTKIMAVIRGFFAGAAIGDPRTQIRLGGGRLTFQPLDFITGARIGVRVALDAVRPVRQNSNDSGIELEDLAVNYEDNPSGRHNEVQGIGAYNEVKDVFIISTKQDRRSKLVRGEMSRASTPSDSLVDQARGSVKLPEIIFYNDAQVKGNMSQFAKIKDDFWVPLEVCHELGLKVRLAAKSENLSYRGWDISFSPGREEGFVLMTRPHTKYDPEWQGDSITAHVKIYLENEINNRDMYVSINGDKYVSKKDLDRFLYPTTWADAYFQEHDPELYVPREIIPPQTPLKSE